MRAPSDATRFAQGVSDPLFPEVDKILSLFKDSCKELVDLQTQIDGNLLNLKKDVSTQDSKHRKTLTELEKGVDGLFGSFARLDSRISSVGQTAAKIGDHLQSADAQRETASQSIELIKYLMEFNSSPGDLMELSPLFSDDSRVAEAAKIAQKLRAFAEEDIGRTVPSVMGNAAASRGLEVAVANLQEYCNELENRLLARFDAASQRRDLSTMAECAKILSQFNRGTSAMQHYVATRPMFIDVEVMNADTRLVLGDEGSQASPSNVSRGLSSLYKEITDTVRKEAATITAVFPSPNEVMSILVQRVLEQRITALLDKLLVKPSLVNLPPMEEGGLLLYLRMLAVGYEKTQELAKDLRAVGCGDLDVEGLTESLFSAHKDGYPEHEQASLKQLYQAKMAELRAESQQTSESSGTTGRSKGAAVASSHQQISVTVVTEFVRWNEEAITRCVLFSSQPATLAANVKSVFTSLLGQVSQYITEGLERARDSLTEAASLRERFVLGTSMSRRVAAAAASAAEAAAAAGESSFRSFMVAVQRCGSSVAIVQQYFSNSISRLLLPVDGAHAASCEEMATAMSSAEGAAYKGLQQCIETVMAEVERLLSSEQKATDYRSPEDGFAPDHRPTNACTRVVAYLSRILESAFSALEGLNKQAFLTELGNRLHKGLLAHWQKFTFNPSGGLRLKRDITEYGEFVRSFNAPSVDEKFELLGIMANVFIVAPESLSTLFEGTPSIRKDAQRFIELRDDYKSAKLASRLSSLWASSNTHVVCTCKTVVLNSALDRQGQSLKELTEELCLCMERAKKEVALKNDAVASKNEALKQQASLERMLHMKSGELDKVTTECLRLQEKNMKLAKELAAFKLVSDFDLKEEDVLNYAALGNGVNNKESIDSLKMSLLSRERVYQVHAKKMTARYNELMKNHRDLAQEKARSNEELEKVKEKTNTLKTRVQESESAVEVKDNEVLRALKASRQTRGERVIQNNVSYSSLQFIMDANSTKDGTGTSAHDEERDMVSLIDDDDSKFSTTRHGLSNANVKDPLCERSTSQKSSMLRSGVGSDSTNETSVHRPRKLEEPLASVTGKKTYIAQPPAADVVILDDVEEVRPVLNIIKESPITQALPRPGDAGSSGGLLGLDGANRLGKWCKQSVNNGSVTRQDSAAHNSHLIAVGTDGRGGRIKVLRSHNQSTMDSKSNSRAPKRCKYGAKTNSMQSQGNLQMEHFFGRSVRQCELDSKVRTWNGLHMETRNGLRVSKARWLRVEVEARRSTFRLGQAKWLRVGDFTKKAKRIGSRRRLRETATSGVRVHHIYR
ncbi:hypothetical protein ACLB2K_076641 [Fragaria x ananassa]